MWHFLERWFSQKVLKGITRRLTPSRATSANICLLGQLPTSLRFLVISNTILWVVNFAPNGMSLRKGLPVWPNNGGQRYHQPTLFLSVLKALTTNMDKLLISHAVFFVYYLRNTMNLDKLLISCAVFCIIFDKFLQIWTSYSFILFDEYCKFGKTTVLISPAVFSIIFD